MAYGGWAPYVPVGVRRAKAARKVEALRKKGRKIEPVTIEGRKIARTFWGEAWCTHLEGFSDYANRLPRGRTYVRNGSVCHLGIEAGRIDALVCGSELYEVRVEISPLAPPRWAGVKARCAGQIGSLLDLLRGRLSKGVMAVVTDRGEGLFPLPGEIRFHCTCPDWAAMCKHVAAVLYGVGARLDQSPELLFRLRGVDQGELIAAEADAVAAATGRGTRRRRIAAGDLSGVFGIDLAGEGDGAAPGPPAAAPEPSEPTARRSRGRAAAPAEQPRAPRKATGRAPSAPSPETGEAVARLRGALGLTRGELARLLGVSAASVGNWERAEGRLNLQARTAEALRAAAGLTRRQVRERLTRR
ncbi:MAG: helix-turn-helix domain-containing protein [Deferrisomatales bacterium]